jgi:tetratricopeptide (TPR) repeat protein
LELLAVAALEGRRFTADAVARALDRNRDSVIDQLDDTLARDDTHPQGIVVEIGARNVSDATGARDLWVYEFAARLDWLTIRRYGLTPSEHRDYSLLLAAAVVDTYGERVDIVAGALARLYANAGHDEEAGHYERMVDIGVDEDIVLWRAEQLVNELGDHMSVHERALGTDLLLAAAHISHGSSPAYRGIAICDRALELAQADSARAEALLVRSEIRLDQAKRADAERDALAALEINRDQHDAEGQANAHLGLAGIYGRDGEDEAYYDQRFRTHLNRCLELTRDPRTKATAYYELGRAVLPDYHRSLVYLQKALPLKRATRDRHGEAACLAGLGFIAEEYEKDRAAAISKYSEALHINREIHNLGSEALMLWRIGRLHTAAGDFERAQRELAASLELFLFLEEPEGEARARKELGSALTFLGNAAEGQAELDRARELYEALGDAKGVSQVEERLSSDPRLAP